MSALDFKVVYVLVVNTGKKPNNDIAQPLSMSFEEDVHSLEDKHFRQICFTRS